MESFRGRKRFAAQSDFPLHTCLYAHKIYRIMHAVLRGARMTKEEILAQLKQLGTRFEDPKIQRRFKEFNKTLQFIFPDIDTQMYMKIGDAELLE